MTRSPCHPLRDALVTVGAERYGCEVLPLLDVMRRSGRRIGADGARKFLDPPQVLALGLGE